MTKTEFFDIYSRLRIDLTDEPPLKGEIEERWKTMEEVQDAVGPFDVERYEAYMRGLKVP